MTTWTSEGKSQDDFMLKDECLILNYNDEVVGHENKYNCHKFVIGQPKGIVHRAFSVLLFDEDGKLLLQQRAASKITFAEVWTNTCCSHPLYGMEPSEVDGPDAVRKGDPQGVKHAAVRKLKHELGIQGLSYDRFTFVTRMHYWAADVGTHGAEAPWGEHEIDYILVCQLDKGETLKIMPEPDEVMAVQWVNADELREAMTKDKWSPWFKIIAERFLIPHWWTDLSALCRKQKFADYDTIHRFDCHGGFDDEEKLAIGSGGAVPGFLDALEIACASSEATKRQLALDEQRRQTLEDIATTTRAISKKEKTRESAVEKKQGAYGKVVQHEKSLFGNSSELFAALQLKYLKPIKSNLTDAAKRNPDVQFCDDMLGRVSRSFAAVIRQLPEGLCLDICVFYLVLRALDTIEDDMDFFATKQGQKETMLRNFVDNELQNRQCAVKDGIGEGDERVLLENFGAVVRVYFDFVPEGSREAIADITRKMGNGMADYVTAELAQGTKDLDAYNLYCHAVAGLVGEGLTKIFIARGFEDATIAENGILEWPFCDHTLGLANSMGLFLQKTNIIRDYLEDYVDGRAFWPQSVWRSYAQTTDLGEFARPTARWVDSEDEAIYPSPQVRKIIGKGSSTRSLECLNALVADALDLVPDALEYLRRLKNPRVYRFCAIPQVMAIATLADCFNNPDLFTGVVKIRKGMAANIILDSQTHDATLCWFDHFARDILIQLTRASADEDTLVKIRSACLKIASIAQPAVNRRHMKRTAIFVVLSASIAAAIAIVFDLF